MSASEPTRECPAVHDSRMKLSDRWNPTHRRSVHRYASSHPSEHKGGADFGHGRTEPKRQVQRYIILFSMISPSSASPRAFSEVPIKTLPPSSGPDGLSQLGNVSHMTGGKMDMSGRQRNEVFAIRPRQAPASRVRRVQSRTCPDTRLLAEGFDISTSSAQHQSSNPVLRRATALQFDIRASLAMFFTSCSWTWKRLSVRGRGDSLQPSQLGRRET
jgi:hypothetical protein